jgi:hypothetical protein
LQRGYTYDAAQAKGADISHCFSRDDDGEVYVGASRRRDPATVCYREPSIGDYAIAAAIFGPFFGAISGFKMAWSRDLAAKHGEFYNANLVTLGL